MSIFEAGTLGWMYFHNSDEQRQAAKQPSGYAIHRQEQGPAARDKALSSGSLSAHFARDPVQAHAPCFATRAPMNIKRGRVSFLRASL